MIEPAGAPDRIRDLSVSPGGRFWIHVVASPEPEHCGRWMCEVSLHHRTADGTQEQSDDLGVLIGEPQTLNDCPSAEAAIEYGRTLGLRLAELGTGVLDM